MFKIDNKIKQEALNFSTLQNCLKMTEGKFEPIFDSFIEEYKIITTNILKGNR